MAYVTSFRLFLCLFAIVYCKDNRADLQAFASAESLTDSECVKVADSTASESTFDRIVKLSCENRILKLQTDKECDSNWLQYIFTAFLTVGILLTMEFSNSKKKIETQEAPKFVCTRIEEVQIEGKITEDTPGSVEDLSETDIGKTDTPAIAAVGFTSAEASDGVSKLMSGRDSDDWNALLEKDINLPLEAEKDNDIFETQTSIEENEEKTEEFDVSCNISFDVSVPQDLLLSSLQIFDSPMFNHFDFVHRSSGRARCYSDPRDRRLHMVDPIPDTIGEISPEMSASDPFPYSEGKMGGVPGSPISKDILQFDEFEDVDYVEETLEHEELALPVVFEEPGRDTLERELLEMNTDSKINERKPMVFVGGIGASTSPLELVHEFRAQGFNVTVVPRIRYGVSFGFCPDLVLSNENEKTKLLSMGRVWVKDRWVDIRQYIPKDEPSENKSAVRQTKAVSSSICTSSEPSGQEHQNPIFVPAFEQSNPPFQAFSNSNPGSNPTSPFVPMMQPMFFMPGSMNANSMNAYMNHPASFPQSYNGSPIEYQHPVESLNYQHGYY